MVIKQLKHSEIDKILWDEKIVSASNGVVYAMSWYLDVVSPSWEALVTEDYRFIMPLPVKSKLGIKYLTQPYFSQQLGLFSSDEITQSTYEKFVNALSFKHINIQMNSKNVFDQPSEKLRPNYILDLNIDYAEIKKLFKSNCVRNLKKSIKFGQEVHQDISIEEYLEFIVRNAGNRPIVSLLNILKPLLTKAQEVGSLEIWVSKSLESNDILSGVVFMRWNNRAYYLVPASSDKGKVSQSMTFLIDRFISSNANSDLVLDFEGSALPGIARFYEGFGAIKEEYPVLIQSKLPKFVKKGI